MLRRNFIKLLSCLPFVKPALENKFGIDWGYTPSQSQIAFFSQERVILYDGAAGGGKSLLNYRLTNEQLTKMLAEAKHNPWTR